MRHPSRAHYLHCHLPCAASLPLERPLERQDGAEGAAAAPVNWRTSMFIASSKATRKAQQLQELRTAELPVDATTLNVRVTD